MRRLIIISLPLLICFAACAKPTPPDIKCELPQEPPMQFDLRNPEHRLHLSDEALLEEDIAVRYSDSDSWKVPGQPQGREAYRRVMYDFNLTIDNLTDKRYFETQNFFESRVSHGAESRERIQATPGYPVGVIVGLTFRIGAKD